MKIEEVLNESFDIAANWKLKQNKGDSMVYELKENKTKYVVVFYRHTRIGNQKTGYLAEGDLWSGYIEQRSRRKDTEKSMNVRMMIATLREILNDFLDKTSPFNLDFKISIDQQEIGGAQSLIEKAFRIVHIDYELDSVDHGMSIGGSTQDYNLVIRRKDL